MKYLPITFRRDGKLERWADQGRIIEQDPSKGMNKLWVQIVQSTANGS